MTFKRAMAAAAVLALSTSVAYAASPSYLSSFNKVVVEDSGTNYYSVSTSLAGKLTTAFGTSVTTGDRIVGMGLNISAPLVGDTFDCDTFINSATSNGDRIKGCLVGLDHKWDGTYQDAIIYTPAIDAANQVVLAGTAPLKEGEFKVSTGRYYYTIWLVYDPSAGAIVFQGSATLNPATDLGDFDDSAGLDCGAGKNQIACDGIDVVGGEVAEDDTLRFLVTKDFTDNNTDSVTVSISCNTGLSLEQDFDIAEGETVEFVVTNFTAGEGNYCMITESDVDNYEATYVANYGAASSDSCMFVSGENLFLRNVCSITNEADTAEYTVEKEWIVPDAGYEEMDYGVEVMVSCTKDILSASTGYVDGSSWTGVLGEVVDSVDLEVDTSTGTAYCTTTENITQSGVEGESSAGCTRGELVAGGSATCKLTNTVFFEGIPTLSQYGMALMALLMLGVGFVGFRRFV